MRPSQCLLPKGHLKEDWASRVSAEPSAFVLPGASVSSKSCGGCLLLEGSLSNALAAPEVEPLEEGVL